MALDISRLTEGVLLPPKLSGEIWQSSLDESAVLAMAGRIDLPAEGTVIQSILSDPEAEWVGETDLKPVSTSGFGSRTVQPYKMALIEPFSDEFKRDLPGLYRAVAARLPKALGRLLDRTVLYGTAPGANFDVLSDAPSVAIGNAEVWEDLLAVYSAITAGGGDLTGWGLSPQAIGILMGSTDGFGRPLLADSIKNSPIEIGNLLGAPVYKSRALYRPAAALPVETPAVIGIAGDWTKAKVGIVEGIRIAMSDQATITMNDGTNVNLWQRNMFALRVEMTVGFRVQDKDNFVRLTQAPATP